MPADKEAETERVAEVPIVINVLEQGTMALREGVGSAEREDGETFEIGMAMPMCHMHVTRTSDGKQFVLTWAALLDAIALIEE